MDIKNLVKCIPNEMFSRLKLFSEKLWKEKNPAAVELSSIIEEFEEETVSVSEFLEDREKNYKERMSLAERQNQEKLRNLDEKVNSLVREKEVLAAEKNKTEEDMEILKKELRETAEASIKLSAQIAEEKSRLVSEYAVRAQQLYETVKGKEEAMLHKWEKKNSEVEEKTAFLEKQYRAREEVLKTKEKALENEFNLRKKELIKTFERLRLDMDVREKDLLRREENVAAAEERFGISPGGERK